jgi:hypothetical protein
MRLGLFNGPMVYDPFSFLHLMTEADPASET